MAAERKCVNHPLLGRCSFITTPVKFLTYPGDTTHMAERNEVVGPNELRELWVAVSAERQGKKTRVGFAPLRREGA